MDAFYRSTAFAFIKFILVGGAGLCLTLFTTYVLTDLLHVWYFWSFLLATAISWTFVFLANAFFTFSGTHHSYLTWKRYFSFIFTYLVVFWLNAGTVYVLTSVLMVPYLISIMIGTITTTGLTFLLSKFVIFGKPKNTVLP